MRAACWDRLMTKDVNRVDVRGTCAVGQQGGSQFVVSANKTFHYIEVTYLLPRNLVK